MAFSDRLKKMNNQWDDTSSGFAELPEGLYTMQIVEATLKETQSGNLRASIQYVVADGEHSGQSIFDGFMLEKDGQFFEMGARMLKGWMERLDYEVPELDELEDQLTQITQDAPLLYAEVKKKGDFTNVRVRERLSAANTPAPKAKRTPKAAKPAADCPFSVGDRVTFEDDGESVSGAITAIDGSGCTVLSDDDEDWEDIPFDIITAEDGGADGGDEDEVEEDDGVTDLLAFCGAHDLEGATDDMGKDDIVGVINEYEWDAKELTEDEVALLEGVGVEVIKPKPRSKKKTTRKKTGRK